MSVYRPRGSKTFVYDFEHRGHRFCGSTGATSKREAESVEKTKRTEAADEIKRRLALGRAPMTMEIATSRYWTEVGQHHKGADNTLWSLDWLKREIGPRKLLRDVTDAVVALLVTKRRADDVAPATVNRSVTEPLRKILRRAETIWKEPVSPIGWRAHMLREPQERVRELRAEEEEALFAELREDYRPIVRFALIAGCRLAECVNLKWTDIDWGGRKVWVRGKGEKLRWIPLTPTLRDLLWPLQVHHPEAVFTYEVLRGGREIRRGDRMPITREGLKSMWSRRKAAAGVTDYRFHDNRHTAATRVLRAGGNLATVKRLLGHESIETTMRYAHVTDDDLAAAMEASARAAEMAQQSAEATPTSNKKV